MGKIFSIVFFFIFSALAAYSQSAEPVVKPDSSAYVPTTYKQSESKPVPVPIDSSDLSFTIKIVPGASKKLDIKMVSPKSGYAEVSLLNFRGDQVVVLHKGKVQNGINTFKVDPAKLRPGLYYVVSKYEGGLQIADKITVTK